MLTIRSLTAALLAVGMAASAHAGIVWQGGMDDARRNAAAFITSPQGKVAGLAWSLDPTATGWKLNRQTGMLQQKPFPFLGGYTPLRPASAYGISGPNKAAVIDVPAIVVVPGKSSTIPVRIIEPVAKSTLAKSFIRAIPFVGNAYALGELLEDVGLRFQNSQWFELVYPNYPVSNGSKWKINNEPVMSGQNPSELCDRWVSAIGGQVTAVIQSTPTHLICRYYKYPSIRQVGMFYQSDTSCPSGWYVTPTGCVQTVEPTREPIDETTAASALANKATDLQLIDALNNLPSDPNVIDVIARELQDDPADEEFRWPSTTPASAPTTFVIGDPLVTTTTNPDGSTVTQTTTTTATTAGDTITFKTTTVTNTYSQSGQLTGTTTTTTTPTDPSNPNSPQQEDLECGLPDKPPCKIDEKGTPQPPVNDAEQTVRDLFSEWQACIDDIQACLPQLPDISWTFSLPSGCSPIPLPGFERWGLSSVDICPYQSMIHNIMSMLWAAAGLFGAIAIISRRRTSE